MTRRGALVLVALLCLGHALASGQIRKGEFVILSGDTDEALRLAKSIKDIFLADPAGRRVLGLAREVIIQGWLEETALQHLTDEQRAALRNPEHYDRPLLQSIAVALGGTPPAVLLAWDVPPRQWPRLGPTLAQMTNRVAREGALQARRSIRVSVKLQDVEMYRVNAEADGTVGVVFYYE